MTESTPSKNDILDAIKTAYPESIIVNTNLFEETSKKTGKIIEE